MSLNDKLMQAFDSVIDQSSDLADRMKAADNKAVSKLGAAFSRAITEGLWAAITVSDAIARAMPTKAGAQMRSYRRQVKDTARKEVEFYWLVENELLPSLTGRAQQLTADLRAQGADAQIFVLAAEIIAHTIDRKRVWEEKWSEREVRVVVGKDGAVKIGESCLSPEWLERELSLYGVFAMDGLAKAFMEWALQAVAQKPCLLPGFEAGKPDALGSIELTVKDPARLLTVNARPVWEKDVLRQKAPGNLPVPKGYWF